MGLRAYACPPLCWLLHHTHVCVCVCVCVCVLFGFCRTYGEDFSLDGATQLPLFSLRADAGRPQVFPLRAIRRHVHLVHACPGPVAAEGCCGPTAAASTRAGGGRVWKHVFKLASSGGRDHYLLNEDHHSIGRDSFV